MSAYRRRLSVVALVAGLALTAPLLTACSLIPHPGGGHGVSLPGVSVGTGKLPKDWPTDVPVIKGDIVTGASLGGSGEKGHLWNASIKVGGAEAADEIDAQLTGAGFTNSGSGSGDDGSGAIYSKDRYTVVVGVAQSSKTGWLANYTVTMADDASSQG